MNTFTNTMFVLVLLLQCIKIYTALITIMKNHNLYKPRVPDQNGVSEACYIVEIYHSGRESSKLNANSSKNEHWLNFENCRPKWCMSTVYHA